MWILAAVCVHYMKPGAGNGGTEFVEDWKNKLQAERRRQMKI